MKISRVIHIRAPLKIRQTVGKKEVGNIFNNAHADTYGGCTVILEADEWNPKYITLQVAWCRFTDNYCRKIGRNVARGKDKELVLLRDLPKELAEIEDQMLCQFSPTLRHNHNLRQSLALNWDKMVKYFLPKE